MPKQQRRHDSFVLRIWWEGDQEAPRIWRGWIQHAATGQIAYVRTAEELLAFIETQTGELDPHNGDLGRINETKPGLL